MQYPAHWRLVPIPQGKKGPVDQGWQEEERCVPPFLIDLLACPACGGVLIDTSNNIGLAHAYSNTCAIDIDDYQTSKAELTKVNIDLDQLLTADDAVIIYSGRKNRAKLLYSIDKPIRSKKLYTVNGTRNNYLDFRCASSNGTTMQDVLPPSIHPMTLKPYQWAGKGDPLNPPPIPTNLLNYWESLINEEERTASSYVVDPDAKIDWAVIESALDHVDPDCGRDEWVHVGMALHHAGSTSDELARAQALYLSWSKMGDKFASEYDVNTRWRSFGNRDGKIVTIGTLFGMARDAGWYFPFDPDKVFADIEPATELGRVGDCDGEGVLGEGQSIQDHGNQRDDLQRDLVTDLVTNEDKSLNDKEKDVKSSSQTPDDMFADVEVDTKELDTEADPKPLTSTPLVDPFTGGFPAPDPQAEFWPDGVREIAASLSDEVGCDPLVPLFAGTSALVGAMDARSRLILKKGFSVPPVVWMMTIGKPADKKTPGSKPLFRTLAKLEEEDRQDYKKKMVGYEIASQLYEEDKTAYVRDANEQMNARLAAVGPDGARDYNKLMEGLPEFDGIEPAKPIPVRVLVDDITSQKLVHIAKDQPRGLFCCMDEGKSWLGDMTSPHSASKENRSTWTKSYECAPYDMDRIGAGSIRVEHFAVNIYMNVQPEVFGAAMNRGIGDDGLLQRFLPAALRSTMTRLGNADYPDSDDGPEVFHLSTRWDNLVRQAFMLDHKVYKLDRNAFDRFVAFQQWYEGRKQDEMLVAIDQTFMSAFGKLEGLVGRFALINHIADHLWRGETPPEYLSVESLEKAINLVQSFVIPSYRYVFTELTGTMRDVRKIMADLIIHHAGEEGFTLRQSAIKTAAKSLFNKAPSHTHTDMMNELSDYFVDIGWVREAPNARNGRSWLINPKLAVMFKERREKIASIKARQDDERRQRT